MLLIKHIELQYHMFMSDTSSILHLRALYNHPICYEITFFTRYLLNTVNSGNAQ